MKAVFLDRDGTINIDYGYVTEPEKIDLIDGAAQAIGELKRAGFTTIVASNQSAIGRGIATIEAVEACNSCVQNKLSQEDPDATLDLILYCGAHPDEGSPDRKPAAGMFSTAQGILPLEPENCWMVGDKQSDVGFGLTAGFPESQCLRLLSGSEVISERAFPSLLLAVRYILSR